MKNSRSTALANMRWTRDTDRMSWRSPIWFMVFCAVLVHSAASAERAGTHAVFLGWNPDSADFAWRATKVSKSGERRTVSYMKRISKGFIAERRPYRYSVPIRTQKKAYVEHEVESVRVGPMEQAFEVIPGRRLRVKLDIHKRRLGYTIYIGDTGQPDTERRAIGGVFDELWSDFSARVFLSPDRKWVAVMLFMTTPYRSDVWVEGLRVERRK